MCGGLAARRLQFVTTMQVVLAIPVAGLIVGAAAGLAWPDIPFAWLVAALCGWALLALHATRVGRATLLAACACGAFAVGGALLAAAAWQDAWRPPLRIIFESIARDTRAELLHSGRQPPVDDTAPVVVTGVLRTDAAVTAGGAVSLAVDAEWVGRLSSSARDIDVDTNPVRGGVLLTVLGSLGREHLAEWTAGRRVRAPADLRRPARYLDPGVPDQERALARRGVSLVGTVKSAALVTVLERGSPAQEAAASLRAFTRRALSASVGHWSPRASAIVAAIVIGDRTGLDDEVERRLQESGTYHVIAISGGNIALLAGLTLGLFRLAGVLGRAAMLSAAAGLVAYGFVVQGGASVNRAVLMACVFFIGRAWDLRGPPFQPLVLVAGILVLADPLSVVDAASLLTFGATAGILAVAPALQGQRVPRFLFPAASMLAASLAAEVALLPIAAFFFSRVTVAGLLLNFGAIPLMAVAQFAGMAVVPLFAVAPAAARVAGGVAAFGAEGLVRTADLVALAPWSNWRVALPSLWILAAYYAALLIAWLLWRVGHHPRLRSCAITACVLSGGCIATGVDVPWRSTAHGRLSVTFIDVGQGDATLIRFPMGSSMLVDAGGLGGRGAFDVGDRVVGPVLRALGVRRLDTLVVTHGDADHAGGATSVLRDFQPHAVWEGIPVPPHPLLASLHQQAVAERTQWTNVQRDDRTEIDGVEVVVRHPTLPEWERQDVRNEDSIVLELRWRAVSFVLAGDIGRTSEDEISRSFVPAPLRVLKVPHHGSLSSSSAEFIAALSPQVAVVSAGRSNPFGHPARAVLERYDKSGTAIFRTDTDGAVTIDTDGNTLDVRTFAGETREFRGWRLELEVGGWRLEDGSPGAQRRRRVDGGR
ncbi:MAG: DNA internalization-related competence protein ComEC/Rec2 [Acidobacteria bacterium]|nr:DNA internalization-related competence protein ComEC/Rec2 [Acidobacteriota bacterium]